MLLGRGLVKGLLLPRASSWRNRPCSPFPLIWTSWNSGRVQALPAEHLSSFFSLSNGLCLHKYLLRLPGDLQQSCASFPDSSYIAPPEPVSLSFDCWLFLCLNKRSQGDSATEKGTAQLFLPWRTVIITPYSVHRLFQEARREQQ